MNFIIGLKDGSRLFGEMVSGLINTALLSAAYLVVLAPTAILARIVGKRFLDLEISQKSTWRDAGPDKARERYYRQF